MRYLSQTKQSRDQMLESIGVSSVDDLFTDVPKEAFMKGLANIPNHMGELEVETTLSSYANKNTSAKDGPFFLGAGCYYHHIPATVDYIIQRSEFLTAYTPYQPEIAQGTLKAIYEYQTFMSLITGQEVSNASMYDGATAVTEAALMAMRITKRHKICIGNALHPDYRGVLNTYIQNYEEGSIIDGEPDNETACVIIQSPDFFGTPHAYDHWRTLCDQTGALLIVAINDGLLPAPQEADIVCGEAQSIGLPMSFGGPHLGFFTTKEKYVRQMPGRLVGETNDVDGKPGYVLTLNTREQHIRREKATSNICTNQGLCALAFTVHMALLGEDGFKNLAKLNHEKACNFYNKLNSLENIEVLNKNFFNEFTIALPSASAEVAEKMLNKGIIAGYALDDNQLLIATTEMCTETDMDTYISTLKEVI
jgi:glycine dehydrogenase subunit 1